MKSLFSWMLAMFMVMFWIFRIVVAMMTQTEESWAGFIVFNNKIEIILLFLTLVSFALIVRRNIIGAILYVLSQGYYFGGYILNVMLPVLKEGTSLSMDVIQNVMVAAVGVLIPVFTLFDIMIEKLRKRHYSDSKTDWFFNGKQYERNTDEKADKNQYRIY